MGLLVIRIRNREVADEKLGDRPAGLFWRWGCLPGKVGK